MSFVAPESDSEALDGDSPCPGASYFAQVSVGGGAGSPDPPAISRSQAGSDTWVLGISTPSPAPPPPRVYKRKETLLIRVIRDLCSVSAAGPSDTYSLAPTARPLGARRLRETPLETCRADKGAAKFDHKGTILGCDWHPVLRVQAGVWGLGASGALALRSTELVELHEVGDC